MSDKIERLKEAVLLLCDIIKDVKPSFDLSSFIDLTK